MSGKLFINDEFISSAMFYIEDEGKFATNKNNYLTVQSLNTYEAPKGDVDIDDRVFLKSFNVDTTRYIMGELRFINLVTHEWNCEFILIFMTIQECLLAAMILSFDNTRCWYRSRFF